MSRFLLILAMLMLGPALAKADAIQSLESIQQAVQAFLQDESSMATGEVVIDVGRIDSRLRLAECGQPLEISWPDGARRVGNLTVGVRCPGPSSWSMFVRARVEVHETILVTSRPLTRGARLSMNDMDFSSQDITRLNSGYYTDPQELLGSVLTRSVRAGTVYTPSLVKAAAVVRRGQRVNIIAETQAIQVRMEGEALSDGAVGDVIRVRNISSRQEIDAKVIGPGLVQVRM